MIDTFSVEHQPGRDLRIADPALGYAYTISARGPDELMYGALISPIGLRSIDVCQLSKSAHDDTIPGLEKYRRFQHIAGIYEGYRHFSNGRKLTESQMIRYMFAAALDDFGHGVKSHSTDIMMEGVGGREKFHQARVAQIIAFGGLAEVFGARNIHINPKTIRRNLPFWVENDVGEPKLDDTNYIAGESRTWFLENELVIAATAFDALEIDKDGHFVFPDHDKARVWGKVGLLLSSEHWNDPLNRLDELIGVEAMKRIIFKRYLEGVDDVDNGVQVDPEDYTFFCDSDFDTALRNHAIDNRNEDGFITAAYNLTGMIGQMERERFVTHKRPIYEEFLADHGAREYPSPYINPHIAKFGPIPVNVEVIGNLDEVRARDTEGRGKLLAMNGKPIGHLKNFKKRQYNPLVYDKHGNTVKLSQVDPIYAGLLRQQGLAVTYTTAMKLLMNQAAEQTFCEALKSNEQAMKAAAENRNPLSEDQLRRVIRGSAKRAVAVATARGMWREV